MLYSEYTIKYNANSTGFLFVLDQTDKQAFEMRFCSKTVFLIPFTGQIFIFIDHNS